MRRILGLVLALLMLLPIWVPADHAERWRAAEPPTPPVRRVPASRRTGPVRARLAALADRLAMPDRLHATGGPANIAEGTRSAGRVKYAPAALDTC